MRQRMRRRQSRLPHPRRWRHRAANNTVPDGPKDAQPEELLDEQLDAPDERRDEQPSYGARPPLHADHGRPRRSVARRRARPGAKQPLEALDDDPIAERRSRLSKRRQESTARSSQLQENESSCPVHSPNTEIRERFEPAASIRNAVGSGYAKSDGSIKLDSQPGRLAKAAAARFCIGSAQSPS